MNKQTNEQAKVIPMFSDEDKRETNFHNFDEHEEVVGELISIEQGSFGDQYKIKTINGEEITIGTYGVLTGKISHEDIGKWLKIVFKGEVLSPKTKRKYKDFDVFIKTKQ